MGESQNPAKALEIHKFNIMSDECGDPYVLALGCPQPLRSHLLLLADIVREQELKEEKAIPYAKPRHVVRHR